jgi:hypothetical protein
MNELLELALNAHGGLERWREVQTIDLKLSITGGLFRIKGFPEGLPNVSMHIEAQRPAVNITPYKTSDGRGYFTPLSSNEEFLRSKRSELCLRRVWIARALRPRSGTIGRARPPVWYHYHGIYCRARDISGVSSLWCSKSRFIDAF